MSETTNTLSLSGAEIGNLAAGLVTAAAASVPGVAKVEAAVEHGAETFEQHNPDLAPVLAGATETVSALAEKHGLETVVEFFEEMFPFLAKLGHHDVTVPSTTAPEQPAS